MAQEIPVIDMWAPLVPTREIMAHVADNFPRAQLGYLRIFQKREPDLDAYRAVAPKLARDDAQILAELDAANVSRALVTGFDEASTAPLRSETLRGATFAMESIKERRYKRISALMRRDQGDQEQFKLGLSDRLSAYDFLHAAPPPVRPANPSLMPSADGPISPILLTIPNYGIQDPTMGRTRACSLPFQKPPISWSSYRNLPRRP